MSAESAVETLKNLDRELQNALLVRDVKFLEGVLSEDHVLITSSAVVMSKKDVLAVVNDPEYVLEVNDSSDVEVRRHCDSAVVTAVLHERGRNHGKPWEQWLRYSDTWVLESGRWLYVSGHASRLPGPPAGR